MLSYWEKDTFFRPFDVAIVGSGLVGLSAAYFLKKRRPDWRIGVFERGVLPLGASTRNAGFACFGSLTELMADLEQHSADEVVGLMHTRLEGLQKMREILGDSALEYQHLGGYELFKSEEQDTYQKCLEWMPFFNEKMKKKTGLNSTYTKADEAISHFGFQGVEHLILNRGEGQLHTGKMMQSWIKNAQNIDIQIFTGVEISAFEKGNYGIELSTQNGFSIDAHRVLVCVNGFARQLLPDLEVEPARNLVLVTKPIPKLRFEGCFHYDAGYFYFRNINGRVLLGGGRHLDKQTENTADFGENPIIKKALTNLLNDVILPNQKVEIEHWWSGIMGVGQQKKPIVRFVQPNTAVAVRMGGMGVAIGTLVGQEAAELMVD